MENSSDGGRFFTGRLLPNIIAAVMIAYSIILLALVASDVGAATRLLGLSAGGP